MWLRFDQSHTNLIPEPYFYDYPVWINKNMLIQTDKQGLVGCSSIGRLFAKHTQGPGFDPQNSMKFDMVVHTCNSGIWRLEDEEMRIILSYDLKANLG